MDINLYSSLSNNYISNSQKIRVLTEKWTFENIFCPSCAGIISDYENNKPVADFYCKTCTEDYELKSKKDKIRDQAFAVLVE